MASQQWPRGSPGAHHGGAYGIGLSVRPGGVPSVDGSFEEAAGCAGTLPGHGCAAGHGTTRSSPSCSGTRCRTCGGWSRRRSARPRPSRRARRSSASKAWSGCGDAPHPRRPGQRPRPRDHATQDLVELSRAPALGKGSYKRSAVLRILIGSRNGTSRTRTESASTRPGGVRARRSSGASATRAAGWLRHACEGLDRTG
jgi:hypothetical protein